MTHVHFGSYEGMSSAVADIVEDQILANPQAHLVLATGASPEGSYRELASRKVSFEQTYVTKLDEWIGVPPDDPRSCEAYLREKVLGPLKADLSRYLSFDGMADRREAECQRVARALRDRPRIDIAILGLGKNGHIAMNEPAESLLADCHVAALAPSTRAHPMLAGLGGRPTHGMTLGMGNLLSARHILMLVSGEGKDEAFEQMMSGDVTTACPATFLQLHSDAVCLECLG